MGMNITPLTRPEVPLTTSNLIVDSDLSMGNYNLQANNLHVDGSILRVVECIPSETTYYFLLSQSNDDHDTSVILPFIPSTYYTGSIMLWLDRDGIVKDIVIYNIDGTNQVIQATNQKTIVNLPKGTISIYGHVYGTACICIGFTNDYLPLPTPPEIL